MVRGDHKRRPIGDSCRAYGLNQQADGVVGGRERRVRAVVRGSQFVLHLVCKEQVDRE